MKKDVYLLPLYHAFEMKPIRISCILLAVLLSAACSGPAGTVADMQDPPSSIRDIPVPKGYARASDDQDSFCVYLQSLRLKSPGTVARAYNGKVSEYDHLTHAVLRMSIGGDPYLQCADAIIKLRSEFLWNAGREDDISFHFTNGFECPYPRWRDGARPAKAGDDVFWCDGAASPDSSFASFQAYLHVLYTFAGTKSLADEMEPVPEKDGIRVGDVLNVGGTPGHAMIVADVAVNKLTGRQAVLLVQGNTPAQDLIVLKNVKNPGLSPWFRVRRGVVRTEKWTYEMDKHHFRFK